MVEPVEAVEGVSAEHALFVGGRLRVVDPGALTLEEAVLLTREGARRRAGLDADEVRLRAAAVEAVHRERLAELTELARTSRGVYRPWAERLRAEFAETDPKVDWWATAAAATELAPATGTSEATMQARVAHAIELTTHRKASLTALGNGELGFGHLRVILEACEAVQPAAVPPPGNGADPAVLEGYRRDVAAEVELMEAQRDWLEAELLAFAPGRTPADLGKKARRVQAKMGPGVLRERVKAAGRRRGVWVEPGTDGRSRMHAELHAVDAVAMMDRIQRIATTLHRVQGEERTMAQLRADVLAALVLGTEDGDTWANIKAEIMVLLPHDVLTGDAGTLLETTLAAMDTTDATDDADGGEGTAGAHERGVGACGADGADGGEETRGGGAADIPAGTRRPAQNSGPDAATATATAPATAPETTPDAETADGPATANETTTTDTTATETGDPDAAAAGADPADGAKPGAGPGAGPGARSGGVPGGGPEVCELAGYGPIDPGAALHLARLAATWATL